MLVIFDCDGVIVDSETIAAQVFSEHLQGLQLNVSPAECFARFKGYSMKTCMNELLEMLGRPIPEHFLKSMQADTFERFKTDLEAVPGIYEAITSLEGSGWKTCIASGGSHSKMKVTLAKVGLWDHFAGRIYSAVDVEHGKPAPDVFLLAAKRQSVPAQHCVVIEDSQAGVEAALAANMRVFYYDPLSAGLRDAKLLDHEDVVRFNDMTRLPELLGSAKELRV